MWCIMLFLRWQKTLPGHHPCWPSSEREPVLQEMWDSFHQHIQLPKTWKTAAWQTGTNDMHWFCEWNICDYKRISWDETTNTCAKVFCFKIFRLWSAGMHRLMSIAANSGNPGKECFHLERTRTATSYSPPTALHNESLQEMQEKGLCSKSRLEECTAVNQQACSEDIDCVFPIFGVNTVFLSDMYTFLCITGQKG